MIRSAIVIVDESTERYKDSDKKSGFYNKAITVMGKR